MPHLNVRVTDSDMCFLEAAKDGLDAPNISETVRTMIRHLALLYNPDVTVKMAIDEVFIPLFGNKEFIENCPISKILKSPSEIRKIMRQELGLNGNDLEADGSESTT